jgi:hypothetical protein
MLIKGTIHQEKITIVNIYTLSIGTPNFRKQTLLDIKSQITPNTIIVGDFNISLSQINNSSRQKANKETS